MREFDESDARDDGQRHRLHIYRTAIVRLRAVRAAVNRRHRRPGACHAKYTIASPSMRDIARS